ncbi:hypothetical protein BKA93DRAFT_811261 [Sparassis latifolia]
MQSTRYVQIGGYMGHMKDAPEAIAQALRVGETGIELVLGIRSCGASYLLLPENRWRGRRVSNPWPAERFMSLSPIRFNSATELVKKLHTLMSKKTKNGAPRDRSKANSGYVTSGEDSSPVGIARATFEHQRVFVMLHRRELNNLSNYALQPAPWLHDVKVFSFACNTWTADTRSLTEREQNPHILDLGWSEFTVPDEHGDLAIESSVHLRIKENMLLQNPRMKRLNFSYGTTEIMDKTAICSRLKQFFAPSTVGDTVPPKILLVHDAQKALKILQAFGVDTSQWESGIFRLLYHSMRGHDSYPSLHQPSVYVIDVHLMHEKLKQAILPSANIPNNAHDLSVQGRSDVNDPAQQGWCAGNESGLLGRMWYSMARGPTIDEQRLCRWVMPVINSAGDVQDPPQAPNEVNCDDEDDEIDPNDMVGPKEQGSAPGPSATSDIYANMSDDDDW